MTLLHFVNCVALACAPYLITYRYSGLLELGAYWRCLKAGGAYFVTQVIKMLLLATFFPPGEGDDGTDLLAESAKCTVDLVDLLGLYLVLTKLSGKGEMKVTATAVGWGTSELVATLLLPLWFGARGVEFDWKYIQSSLDSNINLVFLLSTCMLLWVFSRHDSNSRSSRSSSPIPVSLALLSVLCYRPLVFQIIRTLLSIGPWTMLLVKVLTALAIAVPTLSMYLAVIH